MVVLVGINNVFFESVLTTKLSIDTPSRRASSYHHMIDNFRKNYSELIKKLKENIQKIVICTTTAIEGNTSSSISDKLALVNSAIISLAAEENCGLVDLSLAFKNETKKIRESGNFDEFVLTIDGVHLSERGATVTACAIFRLFSERYPMIAVILVFYVNRVLLS